MKSFVLEKLQQDFLLSRGVLRTVLSKYNPEVKPGDWQFQTNVWGRPHVKDGGANFDFNLSHSEGMIVLAVSDGRNIGVDVERVKENIDLDIAESVFSKEEFDQFQKLPESQKRNHFFRLWVLKESFIKAKGQGLSIGLDQFSFHIDQDEGLRFETRIPEDRKTGHWKFSLFDLEDHKLALCHKEDAVAQEVNIWRADGVMDGEIIYREADYSLIWRC
ncbi:4'-phosphopantetheinyl transferase superfamily protein [Terasakiella sp. A23]|nr:4'-phosphopantetheinyl transferase superfamily protein [Terasakiella sp. A23]MDV7340260.1 4'-phosphopantetheinyl transferase superfamily protein [Terasakiella sp. A23]